MPRRMQGNQIDQISNDDTSAPTGSNDSTQGFSLGDEWLRTSTNTVYKLLAEPSPGNAVWGISVTPMPVDTFGGLVSLRTSGCPELVWTRGGCVLGLRNGCA